MKINPPYFDLISARTIGNYPKGMAHAVPFFGQRKPADRPQATERMRDCRADEGKPCAAGHMRAYIPPMGARVYGPPKAARAVAQSFFK